MTTEERLARLEALFETQGDDIREMKGGMEQLKADVRELLKVVHMGAGAGWLVFKIGAAIVGLAAVLKVVIDAVRH